MTADPFKDMVRRYDRAVVAKGGKSIFRLAGHIERPVGGLRPGERVPPVRQHAPLSPEQIRAIAEARHRPRRAKG